MTSSYAAALALAVLCAASSGAAQQATTATIRVRPTHDGVSVSGAIVRVDSMVRRIGADGTSTFIVAAGHHVVVVSRIGFVPDTSAVSLHAGQDTTIVVALEPSAAGLDAVIISATRAERRVGDTPLRVEVIDADEVAEKAAMTPGDIAMMMNETSGLRVATTSPSLGGANVRIQGLRGRYTLMLTDGLPLYGGQGGFGLLQIPPLDLARVEIIKGTASALYGSSALGGVINLVSRRPGERAERDMLLNQTSRGGTDAVLYASGRMRAESPLGASLLLSAHRQRENDIDDDGWADMAGYERVVIRPRVFYDRDGTSLFATAGYTAEDREGGTIAGRTAPDGAPYDEGLRTHRGDAGLVARTLVAERDVLNARVAVTDQRHRHRFGPVRERDTHRTLFGEASAALPRGAWTLVGGAAYQADDYANDDVPAFDYTHRVPSAFGQIDVDATPSIVLSASGRVDWHNVYGTSVSPRISALFRATPAGDGDAWTARLSAGGGAFAPVPLTEETEATGLSVLRPFPALRRERARSASFDVHVPVVTPLGAVEMNATLYGSRLTDAVAVSEITASPELELRNAPVPGEMWGGELLARWMRGDARITATYAYLRATEWDPQSDGRSRRDVPLAPRHTAGVVASIESEDAYRVGLEIYYTGVQALENNPYRAQSRPYWIVGLLAERHVRTPIGRARVFINAENIGNARQSRFDPLVRPSRGPGGRWTTDVWTELAGATVNGGVRLSF